MHKLKLIFITLFLFATSTLFATVQLTIDKRLVAEADSRGGIFYDNSSIFVAQHHNGLWKSDVNGTLYGDTTASDKQLYDVWKYNGNLFAVGAEGFFIYDTNGNYISSLTTIKGNGLYVQNGFAYVTNDKNGISIIDISDINNPTLKNTILTGQNFLCIRGNALLGDGVSSGAGDLIYITDAGGTLYLFNDDKNGTLTLNNTVTPFTTAKARRIFVNSDGMVYVSSDNGKLAIVSADLTSVTVWTDPSGTSHATSSAPVSGGVFVTTIGGIRYAFITAYDGYIYCLDVTDSSNIIVEDTFIDPDKYKFNDIWVHDSKVYATSHDGFLILTHDITAVPIADYHFDECSWNGTAGEVKDSSGNGFNGISMGANTDTANGVINGSGQFIGDDAAVKVEGITGLDSNNFTVSFWTKIDAIGGTTTHELLKLENVNATNATNGDGGVIELRYRESDDELRVSGERVGGNGYSQTVTSNLDDGNWHHIVLTYIDENMKIYVDTSDADMIHPANGISGVSNLGILDDFNGVLRVGNSINGLFTTKAHIDEVKLYNRALSSDEIAHLHTNEMAHKNADGSTRESVDCQGHIISGTIFEDISGDAFADGDSRIGDAAGDQVSKHGTTLYLYKDDGNNLLESTDTLVATADTDTLGNGQYSFKNLSSGRYYVVVDSTTMPPEHTLKPTSDLSHVWAEQTWGPKGGLCDDGNGTTVTLNSAGTCYGGRHAGISDDPSSLTTAEHVAVVDLSSSDVTDVDFGFSFCVVTHTKDNDDDPANPKSAQGSLRQFIQNANAISGRDRMRFVPAVAPNSGNWWTITLSSLLPSLTDAGTTIDGTAYALDGVTIRDENNGSVSGGIKLGTGADGVTDTGDEPTLVAFDKPELEIVVDSNEQFGFKVSADDITIKNIALYGASGLSGDVHDEDNGNIQVEWGKEANNIVIENNFIGVRADGTIPAAKSSAYGINFYYSTSTNFNILHNYVSSVGKGGIYLAGGDISNGTISQNEVQKVDWFGHRDDGIGIESGVHHVKVFENYVHDNDGPGFESYEGGSDNYWYNNTVYHNGYGTDATEFFGMRLVGTPGHAYQNRIYGNKDAGILVQETSTSGQRIFKNSIYQNGTIGIDLDVSDDGLDGDGITNNNNSLDNNKANHDMDYPIFTFANLVGSTLTLNGYIGTAPNQSVFANATVEVYKVDDDGDGNGEGRWYLGSCSADADGNINCDMTTSLVAAGDLITATATDGNNNTSEFGPNAKVVGSQPYTCDTDAYIFYSDTLDQPTQVNEIDLLNATQTQLSSDIYPVNINGIGYSVVDNFIWGYDTVNHLVTRTDSNLQTVAYSIAGLDPYTFHIGDVSTDGILYLASAYLKTVDNVETDGILRLYRVDVNPSSATYLQKLSEVPLDDTSLYAADFAFHPKNNQIYLIERYSGHIFKIDPDTGHVSDIGDTGLGNDVESHVQFFDKNGYFYFFKDNIFYRSDLTDPNHPNPTAVKFIDMTLPKKGDGARCAYAGMGDKPIITISDASVKEGDSGTTTISFTITSDRNITSSGGVTLNYATSDGSALSGSDYTATSGTITIPQGQSSVTLTLSIINGDLAIESEEDFFITLTASDAYFLDDTARAIILNDDYNILLNAVNTGSPFLDGNLTTQIVNQPFTVTLGAYNETLGSVVADMNITNIDLIDPLGNLYAHLFSGSILTGADGTAVVNLNIPKAYKDTTLKISGIYKDKLYSGKSGDDFAIRPKRFSMQIPPQNIAGKNFTITLAARDANDAPASNYNETINHSFNLNFTDQKKSSCLTGTMDLGSIAFTDGNATHTTHYSETGMLDFNLSEIPGHEFAIIDADDTPAAQRLITAATATDINFTVDHFDISGVDLIDGSNHFTYYAAPADMQQMAARIVLNMTAKNALGATTQNYNGGCYAKDVMLAVHFDTNTTPTQQNRLAWQEDGNSSHAQESALSLNGSVTDSSFVYDIPKMRFVSGENNNSIKINFHRNYTVAKEPMRFTLTRVDAVNSDNRSGSVTESHTGDFYYGRLHASDYMAVGNRLDAKIFHELYCDQCDRKGLFTLVDSPESVDDVRWYRISDYSDGISGFSSVTGTYHTIPVTSPVTSSTTATGITSTTALGAETNGIDNITFTVPKEDLPFKDRIRYLPKPWLIYKKFPSADLRHTFDIDLSVVPKEWAGRGETGYTVDLNVSGRKSGMKLDW